MKKISSKKKIELIVKAALAKKAKDVVSLDLRRVSSICDYFIIASGDSTTHLAAIAGNIEEELLKRNCKLWHKEGKPEALWILLDYGDIIVHAFYKDTRGFYNLERLWHDAPRRKLKESTFGSKPRRSVRRKTKRRT